MSLESDLKELEFTGIEMIWNPVLKQRSQEMLKEYGSDLDVIIHYVIQGGARDLNDYLRGYEKSFKHRENNNWPMNMVDPEMYKDKVKETMSKVALSDENNFIYCPFTKTRLGNVLNSQSLFNADWNFFKDVFCHIYQGVKFENFEFSEKNESERTSYLRKIQILD